MSLPHIESTLIPRERRHFFERDSGPLKPGVRVTACGRDLPLGRIGSVLLILCIQMKWLNYPMQSSSAFDVHSPPYLDNGAAIDGSSVHSGAKALFIDYYAVLTVIDDEAPCSVKAMCEALGDCGMTPFLDNEKARDFIGLILLPDDRRCVPRSCNLRRLWHPGNLILETTRR